MTSISTLSHGIRYPTPFGDLSDSPDTQRVLPAGSEYPDGNITSCLVDVSGIQYFNSTGIDALIALLTKLTNIFTLTPTRRLPASR